MIRLLGTIALLNNRFKPLLISIGLLAVRLLSTTVRMKRLVFIVSLFAHIRKIDACRLSWYDIKKITGELNCNLHLTHSQENTLALPLFVHNSIWSEDICEAVDNCEQVVSKAPSWMRYNDVAMVEDARKVLVLTSIS